MLYLKYTIITLSLLWLSQGKLSAQNPDIELLQRINSNDSEFWRGYSKAISNTTTYVSLTTIAGVATTGLIKNDKQLLRDALYLGVNLGTNALFTYSLKNSFKRPRPGITYPAQITMYEDVSSLSFPSGHTSEAFSTATALSLKYPEWYIIAPAYLWAGSVGYSRMNLGVHYPSDVLAGALLGTGTAFLTFKVNEWLNRQVRKSKK
ncbi:MAG: phosphatase PAP2 family protein [Paludibacter sp.]|jgi:membrane-associated phospholipid phosphatase|nr:phosphatase PAP2 family protein [Paludibacter sp.]